MCTCPMYGLMDFDPDGIEILSTYKHGSKALEHEKEVLKAGKIQWLGLNSKHLAQGDGVHQRQGLLALSLRDRRKATQMLDRDPFTEHEESEWRREIQVMLVMNTKAEIQLLESAEIPLHEWVVNQLR